MLGGKFCFSFWQIFSILQPRSSNLFYQFQPSFCVLFVLWLDRFLDIFVITLHTQRNNTTWQLYLWPSNWPVFNTEMGCSTSRPWPLHVRGRSLRAAVFLTAPVLSPIVPQPSELLLTKWPIMVFFSICQAYRPPLLVWFYKPLFKTLCLIGWRGERRSCHNHPGDQRSPKGPSLQTSWTTSISWGSTSTYRTQRTFSLLHLHSSVQLPTPGWSARKLSDLPAEQGLT